MTHSLQKTLLSFFVSAFLIIAFSSTTQAQEQLNTLWERTTDDTPSWFTSSSVRGMDYSEISGEARLYVADRQNSAIQVLDAETGAEITLDTPFDLAGISGGFYTLNDLEVSEDGKIFLGNLSLDASNGTNPFKFYIWNDEGGTFDNEYEFIAPTAQRIGDRFTVVGSVEDNTAEVWMPVAGSDPGVVYVATTDDQGANWSVETITLSGDNVLIGSGSDVTPLAAGGDSDFYVGGNSSAPTRYNSDGEYIADSELASTSRSGISAFNVDGTDHIAVYSYRADGTTSGNPVGRTYVYDISDPADPTIVQETGLMGDESGNAISGVAHVKVNEDNSYNLYALDAHNGLAAFTNAEAPYVDAPSNLFFSEYIEGSGNNKALEIFNNTDSTVTLSNYQVAQSNNGGGWQYFDGFAEGATIGAGEVYVVLNDGVSTDLFDHSDADEVLSWPHYVGFTGNDARSLIHIHPITGDTTTVDLIGDPDDDASGNSWDVAGVSEAAGEHTLLRKHSVTEGNTTPLGSFGTDADDSEWIVMEQNDFSNLGSATPPPALAGDYYIPQGTNDQGFATFAEAIDAINQNGLSAATTLYIADDLTETSGIAIQRDDLTEDTPLTIKPAAGVTATLDVISGGGDGIAIISADYVTIDGSNTEDGDTRDLTITSSDDALINMVWIKETVNTTIKNTIFTFTGSGYINGITPNESGSHSSTGWLIENNQIGTEDGTFRTGVGLWGFGDNRLDGSEIIGNDIYTAHRGVTSWLDTNSSVIGNNITIVNPREDQAWYGAIYFAASGGDVDITGNTITGLQVNTTEDEGPTFSAGILINGNTGNFNIVNNMISAPDFHNDGDATGNEVFGIMLNYPGDDAHYNVYHNTVHIGSSDETGIHAAFGTEETATTQTWDFQNNIFSVEQDAENAYAFHWPFSSADNLTSNYNNLYVSGSDASAAYFDDAATATLADWQTASEQDENSTSVSVEFESETDLRLAEASVGDHNLAGTPLASVTTDIDGTTRSETHPYKGAFEGDEAVSNETVDSNPKEFTLSQNYPNPFNPTSNIKFTLPKTAEVRLEVFNVTGQLVSTLVNTRMNAGEHVVEFDASALSSGVYIYRITAGSFVQSKKMTLIK